MSTTTRTVYVEDSDGNEIELTLVFEIEERVPGRYSGRPEDCYPDEGGFAELISAKTSDDKPYVLTKEQISRFEDEAYNDREVPLNEEPFDEAWGDEHRSGFYDD